MSIAGALVMALSGCSSSPLSNEPSGEEKAECLEVIAEYEQAIAAFPPVYRAMQEADVLFSNGYVTWDEYKDTQDAVTEAQRTGRSLQKKAFDLLEAGSCPEGTSVPVYAFNECTDVITNGCIPPLDRDTFELPDTKRPGPKPEFNETSCNFTGAPSWESLRDDPTGQSYWLQVMTAWTKCPDAETRLRLVQEAPPELLARKAVLNLVNDPDPQMRLILAKRMPRDIARQLADDPDPLVQAAVAERFPCLGPAAATYVGTTWQATRETELDGKQLMTVKLKRDCTVDMRIDGKKEKGTGLTNTWGAAVVYEGTDSERLQVDIDSFYFLGGSPYEPKGKNTLISIDNSELYPPLTRAS